MKKNNRKLSFVMLVASMSMTLGACKGTDSAASSSSSSSEVDSGTSETVSSDKEVTSSTSSEEKPQESSHVVVQPAFSQASYSYDKNAGGDMQLPLDLKGSNIFYVSVGDETLTKADYSYDKTASELILKEDYLSKKSNGTYAVKVITDAENAEPATCTLEITNSIVTSFDENTTRSYRYGKDQTIKFSTDFSTATIKEIADENGNVVDPSLYSVTENVLSLNHEIFDHYYGSTTFSITLSNKDVYHFTINNSATFFTDYDVTTINNTTESHTGQNPLYQYAYTGNEAIIDGTSYGMKGNVMEVTPNYVDNDYHCHGYFTLKSSTCPFLWYDAGFTANGLYHVSFDYETLGSTKTDDTTFAYQASSSTYHKDLLMGSENDGKVHHFSDVIKGSEIGNGLYIYAFWKNGTGKFLIDNFRVDVIDDEPVVGTINDTYKTGAYTIPFTDNGYAFSVKNENGTDIPYTYVDGIITIKEEDMKGFQIGTNRIYISTMLKDYQVNFNVVDTNVASLSETTATYIDGVTNSVKLKGSFGYNVTVRSVTMGGHSDNGGYDDGWEFYSVDTAENLSSLVTLKPGLDDTGYLTLSKDLLAKAIRSTDFNISFSNGGTQKVTVTSNVLEQSNYDDITMIGSYNGGAASLATPLNSGMLNSQYEIKDRETGNKALYVTKTTDTVASCLFTTKFNAHVWQWYTLDMNNKSDLVRFKFKYAVKNVTVTNTTARFRVMSPDGENKDDNFFDDIPYTDHNDSDKYTNISWPLVADGQVHEIDTGWFTYNSVLRMTIMDLPIFAAAEDTYVMVDDFQVTESQNYASGTMEFTKNVDDGLSLTCPYSVSKVEVGGKEVTFSQTGETIQIAADDLNSMDLGEQKLKLMTSTGVMCGKITIKTNETAKLTETSKSFKVGDASVTFAGEFSDTVTVSSATKKTDGRSDPAASEPESLDTSKITLSSTGLTIGKDILDYLYDTSTVTVTCSNGSVFELTLTSSQTYFCNFNEVTNYDMTGGNVPFVQDTNMQSLETGTDGRKYLVYKPANATLGHSSYLGTDDNRIFTMINKSKSAWGWAEINIDSTKTYVFSVTYEATGVTDKSQFMLCLQKGDTTTNSSENTALPNTTAKTTITAEMSGSDFFHFSLRCLCTDSDARAAFSAKIYQVAIYEKA